MEMLMYVLSSGENNFNLDLDMSRVAPNFVRVKDYLD